MFSRKIIHTLIVILVVFALIGVSAAGFYFGFSYVLSQNSRFALLKTQFEATGTSPITMDTPDAVEIYIPRSSDTQDIAAILKNREIIDNSLMFNVLSKFNGFDGAYIAGTHYVTPDMSYDEIMYVLTQKPLPVRITFPEGLTYKEVKALLKKAGVSFDEAVLDEMVRKPNLFLDYDFVKALQTSQDREWLLQGYLFPDTYEFDRNSDEETILRTFLNNTKTKLSEKYYTKAAELGLTMDQIITLASVIQAESGISEEMPDVSAVFHNRINVNMPLESCATVNYLRTEDGQAKMLWLSNDQIDQYLDNPYNTYKFQGLPAGPIDSPGMDAIQAALWPSQEKYLYFCAKGDEEGGNAFADNLDQQNANIAFYQNLANQAAAVTGTSTDSTTTAQQDG